MSAVSFDILRQKHPHLNGPELAQMVEVLPEADQAACWQRLANRAADRHHVRDGAPLPKLGRRKAARPRPIPGHRSHHPTFTAADDPLKEIPAETYLEVLAPNSEPNRGRCRCPLPDHEDRNPSASYKGRVWMCHRCGIGGDVYTLGSALSGLADRGDEFCELRRWLAERMLAVVA